MKLKLRRNKEESRKAKTEKEEEEKKMNKWTGWGFHVCSLSSRLFLLWRIDMNMDFFFFFFFFLFTFCPLWAGPECAAFVNLWRLDPTLSMPSQNG